MQVLNNLTIGDYDPSDQQNQNALTEEALQKIQAQIINPTQTIHINQKTGDDDNDGSSSSKAVRTLDRAIELMKANTPTITFALHTHTATEDLHYNKFYVSTQIPDVGQTTTRFIRSTTVFPGTDDNTLAEIVVPYGKNATGSYYNDGSSRIPLYIWGNSLMNNAENVECSMVKFSFPETASDDDTKVINCVFFRLKKQFTIDNQNQNATEAMIETSKNNYLFNMINDDISLIKLFRVKITGDTILNYDRFPKYSYTGDPLSNNPGYSMTSNYSQPNTIAQYIFNAVSISDGAKGTTKGLGTNTTAIYTNLA